MTRRSIDPALRGWMFLTGAAAAWAPLAVEAQDSSKVKVEVRGVDAVLERNVLAVMRLARAADEGPLTRGDIQRLYQRSQADIRLALQPFGFYQPVVESSLEPAAGQTVAKYLIDHGPAIRVKSVRIVLDGPAKDAPEFREAVAKFPVHEGDPLHHASYEAGKLLLLTIASDSGYLDARFDTSAVLVDTTAGTATVDVRFITGPRFHFGPVVFQQKILDDAVLRRRIPFRTGDPWKQSQLLELQTTLAEDPYWVRVEVMPQRRRAKGLEVPIRVVLEPRKPRAFEFGLGYGTDTGPRGRVGADLRWVNRRGHNVTSEVVLSTLEQSVSGKYVIPAFGHPAGDLTFQGGYARLVPTTSISRAATIGVRLDRHRIDWRQAVSLMYHRESFGVGLDSGVANLLIGGVSWERTRADDRLFPSRGLKTTAEVEASQKGIIGTTSFLQIRGTAKAVVTLRPRLRLLVRGEVGRTFTRDFHGLPPTLRFFAGGDQSVRGFDYQELGPVDSLGNVIGGSAILVASAEVDYHVLPRWLVAAFTDYGNATTRLSLSGLEQSAGVGIRFLAPIGLIRLDLAMPLSRANAPIRLHFTIGPDL